MKTIWLALVTVIFISFTGINHAQAFQKKQADTVSTSDVQFTTIPTAADSIAARKKAAAEAAKAKHVSEAKVSKPEMPKTLWQTFLIGLALGFAAFLMPCIYPLLPLTVSFFLKLGGTRIKAAGFALFYMLSIIIIYVSLGMVLSIIFGPDTLNNIATNGTFNIIIFLLLVIFGISFLGAFEIVLPSSLVNKVDSLSDKGGIIGIFFMALTLVVVSFSCTAGVVAGDLASAFRDGDRLAPVVSLLGFSTALGLPFAISALFPSIMQGLPKSGGWLNSVKVILGFLELAFALKFLSNVDLAYHWDWLDREVFLSLWIAIGLLMGLYLIGKIRFSHDSDVQHLSIPRLFIAIIVFAFVIYMIPGLWGAPLKSISAFLPPPATQDFDLSRTADVGNATSTTQSTSIKERKYADRFTRLRVKGLDAWYDYDQALQVSKELHKPILIDFTGFACVNCRKMENTVWINPTVFKHLRDDFVLLQLVVDDKSDLDPKEQFVSSYSGKKITTLGGKWADLELSRFNANAQPFYVILDSNGDFLKDKSGKDILPSPYDNDIASYTKFL
ncbi:MAG TPA: thioredoxin family protein, partial [Mucilaginibacter sp.]|nr:thioredoxin family protein [Mucilaginibacter sp.]